MSNSPAKDNASPSNNQGPTVCAVKVICRFRPLNEREKQLDATDNKKGQVTFKFEEKEVKINYEDNREVQSFAYDRVFWNSTQKEVYEIAAKPTIEDVLNGYNGQTGTGKSFTMFGAENNPNPELKGIIPRACVDIFQHIREDTSGSEFTVYCSFLEIYNETLRDLLSPKGPPLKVRETGRGAVWVENLTEQVVKCEEDVFQLLETGEKSRAVSTTNMNEVSSRSHSLFILNIHAKGFDGLVREGRLNLVDLAGSEQVSKTGATGTTLEEAKKINQSLSALGACIFELAKPKRGHIPYRNSKLTHVLRESLGGNCKITLLIACSPHKSNLEETISTLKFGQRAKKLKSTVTQNKPKTVEELTKVISAVSDELIAMKKYVAAMESEMAGLKGPQWDPTTFRKKFMQEKGLLDESGVDSQKVFVRSSSDLSEAVPMHQAEQELAKLKEETAEKIKALNEKIHNLSASDEANRTKIMTLKEKLSKHKESVKKLESQLRAKEEIYKKQETELESKIKEATAIVENHAKTLREYKIKNETLENELKKLKRDSHTNLTELEVQLQQQLKQELEQQTKREQEEQLKFEKAKQEQSRLVLEKEKHLSLGKAKLEQLKQERDRLNKEWMAQQEKEKTTPPASPSQPTNASHPTSTPLTHSAPTPTSKPETPNANIANEPKRVTFQDHSAKKPVSSTKVVRDKFKQKKLDQARGAATKSHDSLPNRPKPKMKISGKLNVVHIAHNVSEETSEMKTITKDDVGDAAQTDPLKNPPDDDGALPPRVESDTEEELEASYKECIQQCQRLLQDTKSATPSQRVLLEDLRKQLERENQRRAVELLNQQTVHSRHEVYMFMASSEMCIANFYKQKKEYDDAQPHYDKAALLYQKGFKYKPAQQIRAQKQRTSTHGGEEGGIFGLFRSLWGSADDKPRRNSTGGLPNEPTSSISSPAPPVTAIEEAPKPSIMPHVIANHIISFRLSASVPQDTKSPSFNRDSVITEIVETERDYVNDLYTIVGVFIQPLKSRRIISERTINDIFSNIETLANMHAQVLMDLEKRMQAVDEKGALNATHTVESVGDIFQQMADYFKMYKVYCANQGNALQKVTELQATNPAFRDFLKECTADPRCRQLNLNGFLIKPVQRICKYPLLFKELVRNTKVEHPDYPKLLEVKTKIEEIVNYVNEGQRVFESQQKILQIQNTVDGLSALVAPTRVFVREGSLMVQTSGSTQPSEHQIYLFNDLILFCKKKEMRLLTNKEYNLMARVPMETLRVGLWADDENIFLLYDGQKDATYGKVYVMGHQESKEAKSWFDSIKSVAEDFSQKLLQRKSVMIKSVS